MINTYDVIYLLKPDYEVEPALWKLKWKPIFRHTYSIYLDKYASTLGLGIFYYNADANNGWHRSFCYRHIGIRFLSWELCFWIRYNFIVHKDGPSDGSERRPLFEKPTYDKESGEK